MKKPKPTGHIFEASATLIGAVVGAGVLGIPFAVAKVGFGLGVVMLIALAVGNTILQLMFAEVTLRTKEDHQVPGYGGIYLGITIKRISLIVGVLVGYGTLLAYLIGQGEVIQAMFGGNSFLWSIAFLGAGSYIIYRGLDTIKILEVIMTLVIFVILAVIGSASLPYLNIERLYYWNFKDIIVPYGVLLFALSGTVTIPQVRQELLGNEKKFPRVIILANVIIFSIYLLFMFFVLGVNGTETTEVATIGLGKVVGPWMVYVGNLLAFFTITTSFLTVGLAMRRVFQYDYSFSREKALAITVAGPLVLFLMGTRDFIQVLGLVGGILFGIQSSIIVFTFWKAHIHGDRKPEFKLGTLTFTGIVLLGVFVLGALATLISY